MGNSLKKIILGVVLFGSFLPLMAQSSHPLNTSLTLSEEKSIEQRLETFYRSFDPQVMNLRIPKFNVLTGQIKQNKSTLDNGNSSEATLSASAGKKMNPSYLESRRIWLKKRLKSDPGDLARSNVESADKIKDLVETYLSEKELVLNLDQLPTSGEINGEYWSGDFWNMNWGLTSYRYSTEKKFRLYRNAVDSYFQPDEWFNVFENLSPKAMAKEIEAWAPSEKYDLLVGDEKFNLTREQKNEGSNFVDSVGKVESWFGICDGWSPASVFVPTPQKSVESVGLGGVKIKWYPDDIRALASLAWTNGDYKHNLVGRRCNISNPKTYKNGRISEVECADTNPATFHLALGNLIGKRGIPFIMDASFDAQVWNQPVLSYEIKYFNPLNRRKKSFNWRDVVVPYDDKFKIADRFQKPLTRGYRKQMKYFDGGVKAIVGVQATVVYLAEYQAVHDVQPQENMIERVVYTYDLELHQKEGELVPMGGEWHNNTHPDFLWMPQNGAVAHEKWDEQISGVNLSELPNESLIESASKASKEGYPLCRVIEALVNASSRGEQYRCPH
jgi:hypothetical protein